MMCCRVVDTERCFDEGKRNNQPAAPLLSGLCEEEGIQGNEKQWKLITSVLFCGCGLLC